VLLPGSHRRRACFDRPAVLRRLPRRDRRTVGGEAGFWLLTESQCDDVSRRSFPRKRESMLGPGIRGEEEPPLGSTRQKTRRPEKTGRRIEQSADTNTTAVTPLRLFTL